MHGMARDLPHTKPHPNQPPYQQEVRANCFMLHESKKAAVARGKNLGVTVAENKGGVGLAFRYFDTTFAVLNTHLASDLKV